MRKRNHIIPLHLNKKELAHLEAQVKTSGLPREEFLRTLITVSYTHLTLPTNSRV
mgnify:CR=1 FL=1